MRAPRAYDCVASFDIERPVVVVVVVDVVTIAIARHKVRAHRSTDGRSRAGGRGVLPRHMLALRRVLGEERARDGGVGVDDRREGGD